MSIMDSFSEYHAEQMTDQAVAIRSAYDKLSVLWVKYPNEKMVYALDDLLKVWEQVLAWRAELERMELDGE